MSLGFFCDIYKILTEEQQLNLFNTLLNDVDKTKYDVSHIVYNTYPCCVLSDIRHPLDFIAASRKFIYDYSISIPPGYFENNSMLGFFFISSICPLNKNTNYIKIKIILMFQILILIIILKNKILKIKIVL